MPDKALLLGPVEDIEARLRTRLPDPPNLDGAGHGRGWKDRQVDVAYTPVLDLIESTVGNLPETLKIALAPDDACAVGVAADLPNRGVGFDRHMAETRQAIPNPVRAPFSKATDAEWSAACLVRTASARASPRITAPSLRVERP